MKKITIEKILSILIVFCMLMLVFLIAVQVISRFILPAMPVWSSEDSTSLMILWLSMLGAAAAASKREHISVDLLASHLPRPLRIWLDRFVDLLVFVFCIVFLKYAWQLSQSGWKAITPRLRLPMFYLQFSMVVGMALIAYFYMKHLILSFFKKKEVEK